MTRVKMPWPMRLRRAAGWTLLCLIIMAPVYLTCALFDRAMERQAKLDKEYAKCLNVPDEAYRGCLDKAYAKAYRDRLRR